VEGYIIRKKYIEKHIIAVRKEAEAGAKLSDLCRKCGMSDTTYYNREPKYSGITNSDLKRLKSLEEENRRLKQIVVEQAPDNLTLKELPSKNF
jgi:putative transposase